MISRAWEGICSDAMTSREGLLSWFRRLVEERSIARLLSRYMRPNRLFSRVFTSEHWCFLMSSVNSGKYLQISRGEVCWLQRNSHSSAIGPKNSMWGDWLVNLPPWAISGLLEGQSVLLRLWQYQLHNWGRHDQPQCDRCQFEWEYWGKEKLSPNQYQQLRWDESEPLPR